MQTISANNSILQRTGQIARSTGGKAQQTTVGTAGFTANGFLNHRFLPLYEPAEKLPEIKDLEKGVYNSLSILEKYHTLDLIDVSDKPYPYNVLLTYWDLERQICKSKRSTELFIISDDNKNVKLATRETVLGGSTVYYIPVLPLYRLMESGKDKKSAALLLSVCAYLYQIVQVPHYREPDSYLNFQYGILEDWLEDDWDQLEEQDIIFNRTALRSASHFGDIMHRRIYNRYNLEHLQERIEKFSPSDEFGRDCLKVAQTALHLWKSHPDGFLFRHINNGFDEENEDDEDEDAYYDRRDNTLYLHEYVHFIAETEGRLYDSLFEIINSEFNEKRFSEEPNLVTIYDHAIKDKPGTLEFEEGLFELIIELCTILNDLP